MLVDPVLLELAEVPREVEVDHGQDRDQEEHQVLPHVCPSHDLQSEEIQSFTLPPHLFPERARAREISSSCTFAAAYCNAPRLPNAQTI